MSMSKTLQRLAKQHPDKIESISIETDTGDGYWLYLKHPYWNPDLETSFIHEWTVKDCLRAFQGIEKHRDADGIGGLDL